MKDETKKEKPPVIAIMGHIDHGKSTLLDFIRKSNVVEKEAGGITQHISAYEVEHKGKKITFLDTPGHEAFRAMRSRGANIADIAILVVAADDGVKEQTKEVYSSIKKVGIPYIVAINKIDKPEADVQKTINSLIENEIYLEGFGGNIPFVKISAKKGENINELLDTILLVAELEELKTDEKNATGYIIESNVDPKKGISATLLIKDGLLEKGMCVKAGNSISPVRIMEDFLGKTIDKAVASSPIRVTGFNTTPKVGVKFESFKSKKDAEKLIKKNEKEEKEELIDKDVFTVPLVIKTDVLGTGEAIKHELNKIENEHFKFCVIHEGLGDVMEDDIRRADKIVIGFNVSVDSGARDVAERSEVIIKTFDVIYELTKWLQEEVEKRRPKIKKTQKTGTAKILKIFSRQKDKQVVGGKVKEGKISVGTNVNILRRNEVIGEGKILELQQLRSSVSEIKEEGEFGAQIESKIEIAPSDFIESIIEVEI